MQSGSQETPGFARKLTLISAPAGFGKTTLVSDWLRDLRSRTAKEGQSDYRTVWVSLDEGDNEPTRFLAYLIAGLQTIEAHVGKRALSILRSPQPPPTEAVLTSLINDIAAIPGQIILVLDDYHTIDVPPIHDTLAFLLEHLPPQMHLVIATRVDPPLPVPRLRARGQLTELRATDLRFASSESAEFLNQVMGLDLSLEDITALERRTEGWIAGLQMAAISMQGRKDATSLIQSFTGSHRFILDYLVEEVLEQQPGDVQGFLLKTSVLARMTAPLCDLITDRDDSQEILEKLERANLFIIRLDEERRWYRYHELFADLLRHRLRQAQPEQLPTLHRRASEWYEQNGFQDEAIEHALRADDSQRAATLIEEHADAMWRRGEHEALRTALVGLPEELVLSRPHLSIFQTWYLFAGGQQRAAERSLQAVEQALEHDLILTPIEGSHRAPETSPPQRRSPDTDRARLRGRAAAIRAFMASYRGDIPGIIQHAGQALEHLPEQDTAWRCLTGIVLGDAQGFTGDMNAAFQARQAALEACQTAGHTYYVMLAYLKLAITLREQGRLQRTLECCQRQMQLAKSRGLSHGGVVGWSLATRGEVLAEMGDLEEGIRVARRGAQLAARAGDSTMRGWSTLCLVRALFSSGDTVDAEEILQRMAHTAREPAGPPWITNQIGTWQARLWVAQNKLEAASQWARERGLIVAGEAQPPHVLDYFSLIETIVAARILIARGQLDGATDLLQRLLKAAEAGNRTTRVIEILLLQALVSQARGDTSEAMSRLEQALGLAEPGGFIRIFVDEGPPVARLLHEAAARGIRRDYAGRLLALFEDTTKDQGRTTEPTPSSSATGHPSLIEPLSERELEVLQLIAEGLTNREIAARFFLSLNTVKTHTRNIYGKLNVHSRTHAVARSRALGLLPRSQA
jgi:LuxR family maltose regulon positive regulatory protein